MMLQTVSCFRSTGSMPVPRPVSLIIPHYLPHRESKKRRSLEEPPEPRLELVLRHATVLTLDTAQLHTAGDTGDSGEAVACEVVLQKVPSEFYPKVCNHGEGPY